MLLPPAQSPEVAFLSATTSEHQNSLSMNSTGRSSTAFAEYLERKKQGSLPSTPLPPERTSPSNDAFQREHSSSLRSSRAHPRQSQPDQSLKRSLSQQQQQQQQQLLRSSSGIVRQQQASPESLHQTLRVAPAAPKTPSHSRQQQQQQDVDYLSLTNAARSLAEAANSLANSLSPKAGHSNPGFQQAIADAAQDVANNGNLLSNLPPPKSATQLLASDPAPHASQHNMGSRPRTQSAAPQGPPRTPSGWYDTQTQNGPPSLMHRGQSLEGGSTGYPLRPSSRASTPNSTRVHAPKFPPVNPIVAMRATEQPTAYSPAAYGASGYGGPGTPGASRMGTPMGRPYTANPITHTLDEGPRPATGVVSRAGSSRGSAHGLASRTYPVNGRTSPGPGDAGGQASQVLSVPGGGAETSGEQAQPEEQQEQQQQQQQRPESRAGHLTNKEKEVFDFMARHPERIRLSTWPPPESYTESEIMRDDAAQRYNGALDSMRYRLYTHGTKPMMNAFKIADNVRSGSLDTSDFKRVLANLDFGTNLDEKVLNEIVAGTDKTSDGKVDYLGFITALRFNTLPNKPYNKKFKHRVAANPDMPCGNPGISYPYGTLNDKRVNDQKILNKMNWKHMDLRQAFEMMDSDADGFITYGEFKNAMKDLNERHHLRINDDYISKAFREADWDFNRAIDYDEFLSTFAGSAGSRFVPEFMKPQSLRCSTLTAPWEDQRCHIMADTRRAQEAAALDSTAKSPPSRSGWRPGTSDKPSTPLANESSRLLRNLS